MAIIENKYRININDVGISNLITNRGMLSILEDIACRHSDSVGFGINDIATTHLSWILLAWKVKITKRMPYGTYLTVRTWAKCVNKFQTLRDFEVLDENGELVCQATSKWTLIDTEKGSITRITDNLIQKYKPETKDAFENPEIEKLIEPKQFLTEYTYVTQRRDIDVNKHMHNLNYLSLAYEALPEEVYYDKECNNIEIMYKKGITLGDTVKCLYSYQENSHYVTIKSEDEKNLHAIIKLSKV